MSGIDDEALAAEIEKALARPGPFLVMPASLRLADGARQAFTAAAKAAGRTLGLQPHSPALDAARKAADVPTIPRGDSKKFLANIREIAAGRVRVE
jgi:hypothetical protein